MIQLILKDVKCLRLNQTENVYAGENKISEFSVILPEKITQYKTAECEIEMRSFVSEDRYISTRIDTSTRNPKVPITSDLTEKAQIVPIMFFITHEGNVIGKTNFEKLNVLESKDGRAPLDPREELDEIIAELRAEKAQLKATVSDQAVEITEKIAQITELNNRVDDLTEETTEQAEIIERQETTIDQLNSRVPALQQLDPINPSGIQQTYNPESPNIGFPQVIVNPVTAEGTGFRDDYYKEGAAFLDKVGTYNPFPEHSYGGVYITEKTDDGYPIKLKIVNWDADNIIFALNSIINESTYKSNIKEVIFENCKNIRSVTSLSSCALLEKIVLSGVRSMPESGAFQSNPHLKYIDLGKECNYLGYLAFHGDYALETLLIPGAITEIHKYRCATTSKVLKDVILGQGFNASGFDISSSTLYSVDTLVAMLEALADRTGETAYTLTIGTTNINKLTAEQRSIATNKNWNLA